jgi:hypothetical protein
MILKRNQKQECWLLVLWSKRLRDGANDLAAKLQRVQRGGSFVQAYRNHAQSRVTEKHDWDYVVHRLRRVVCKDGREGATTARCL